MNKHQSNKKEKISFVIPCYNSTNTIGAVVGEIIDTLNKDMSDYDYEIILVNDGSPDGTTFDVITALAKNEKHIKGINLSRNFGQHAAIMAGLHYVDGDYIVLGDDDGQTPFNEFPKLFNKLNEGHDIVSAKYQTREKRSLIRKLGTAFNEATLEWLIGKPKNVGFSSYCIMKGYLVNQIIKHTNPYPSIGGIGLAITHDIANVELIERERARGKSGYNIRKLIQAWFNGFSAFSIKPLRIATCFGVIISFSSFFYGIYIIIRKLINPQISAGFSSIMTVMAFMFGMIFFFMGLIGEYIGRIYININNSPQFVVKETVASDNKLTEV